MITAAYIFSEINEKHTSLKTEISDENIDFDNSSLSKQTAIVILNTQTKDVWGKRWVISWKPFIYNNIQKHWTKHTNTKVDVNFIFRYVIDNKVKTLYMWFLRV